MTTATTIVTSKPRLNWFEYYRTDLDLARVTRGMGSLGLRQAVDCPIWPIWPMVGRPEFDTKPELLEEISMNSSP
eukprot:73812-Pyramimonas_sp.AAC.2